APRTAPRPPRRPPTPLSPPYRSLRFRLHELQLVEGARRAVDLVTHPGAVEPVRFCQEGFVPWPGHEIDIAGFRLRRQRLRAFDLVARHAVRIYAMAGQVEHRVFGALLAAAAGLLLDVRRHLHGALGVGVGLLLDDDLALVRRPLAALDVRDDDRAVRALAHQHARRPLAAALGAGLVPVPDPLRDVTRHSRQDLEPRAVEDLAGGRLDLPVAMQESLTFDERQAHQP